MNNKIKKKAFTLPEVVIALSIIIVVLAMTTSLVIVVSNISKKQIYMQNCQNEYQAASKFVDEFFNTYSFGEPVLSIFQKESGYEISIQQNGQDYKLEYNKNQKKMTSQILNTIDDEITENEIVFEHIINITFSVQDNLIKCEYFFGSYPTMTNLVVFGVA